MNIKIAKKIFNDIAELCISLNNNSLTSALPSIYDEVDEVETVEEVIELISEIMFYVDEIDETDDNQEIKFEIQELYNRLQDEL